MKLHVDANRLTGRFHGPLVFLINHKQYSAGEVGHQNIWDTLFTLSLNKEYVHGTIPCKLKGITI